ncbi:MAG: transcription termination/antitermination factor NusG [Ruminococcaceae bacterium]|nr:transcription termination/antitermination factor NusG [Oscillospiraceae bacterium]
MENANAKWYVIHTYSGYENKVKTNIEKTVDNLELHDKILEVRLPEEDVVEVKEDGTQKESKRKLFPGYLFVKMVMDSETWYIVRNTRGVTSFVGPGSEPVELSEEEIANLSLDSASNKVSIKVGDTVRITEGLFPDYIGEVQSVDEEEQEITVKILMGSKEVSIRVPYTGVELN